MIEVDILIIGSGIVGQILARAIIKQGYSVLIIENSFFQRLDTRYSAISYGSKIFLEQIDLWPMLDKYSSPILDIHTYYGHVSMGYSSKENMPMGYLVPNSIIRSSLSELNKELIVNPCTYKDVQLQTCGVKTTLENDVKISSKLIVSAEGRNSSLRKRYIKKVFRSEYNQVAMVFNVEHHEDHFSIAQERFFKDGPLAFLPMQKKNQSAVIWTVNDDLYHNLSKCAEEEFINALNYRSDLHVNKLLSSRSCYSLSLSFVLQYHVGRLLFMGDALHSLHPVAGQGLNLSIQDIRSLSKCLLQGLCSATMLDKFSEIRKKENIKMIAATDSLVRFFSHKSFLRRLIGGLGIKIMDNSPWIKSRIVDHAADYLGSRRK